ncbi:MAG: hypothetical protein A2X25_07380 [Chloroflexi bacterium GWB2_49_20]|nr:MAG: hypothetical protein A2X25_07380 [Chloroflexi bacterium GWB2_49_20]OGN77977.1 MAG: hypothetical protein A2X26_15185 [Chloroflexi bacterium GWC2_49_37]OGN85015.1 MAG: hypothetical protein A2X27_09885 [Chloroflexi bacterium GWD2_49_16]HBG74951.1 hypothetical protein [Anaerolineae bacterium]HCC78325.1 hypothetical protein [Anaerolineae bacterium]
MKDDFLTKYHTQPPREFSAALYAHIAQPKPRLIAQKITLRNTALVIATLVLVIACVRIVTMPRWVEIGNIWVDVKPNILIPTLPHIDSVDPPQEQATSYTLSDIKAAFDGALMIPDWVPDGYTFDSVIQMADIGTDKMASLSWKGSTLEQHIQLYARSIKWWYFGLNRYVVGPASTFPVAPGSYREVQVNGQSTVSVRGDWAFNDVDWQGDFPVEVSWDKKAAIQLYWIDGEWLYHITASQDVSIDDLIRMAESSRK